jgi:putative endonuclease
LFFIRLSFPYRPFPFVIQEETIWQTRLNFSGMLKGNYFVYITTNPKKTILYVGVTNDLLSRMQEHFNNRGKSTTFAGKYYCYKLVYYERYQGINQAIAREKELNDLSREKKEGLINELNPHWNLLVVS